MHPKPIGLTENLHHSSGLLFPEMSEASELSATNSFWLLRNCSLPRSV